MHRNILFSIVLIIAGLSTFTCKRSETGRDIPPIAITSRPPVILELKASEPSEPEFELLPGPNAVPTDTRIVINAPAYRLDVFHHGILIRSYKIGIGYPAYPLPTGLRKAETIIFNPTWTPPNERWVSSIRGASPGQPIRAGSPLNPLGPVKIPIGMPSLIHGGKPVSKLGTFASHGCVGMTNVQVQDLARVLTKVSGTGIPDDILAAYLNNKARTRLVTLGQVIPVELRYETIVVQDGSLHIYRDVYGQNTNTEQNLSTILAAHGLSSDDLTDVERTEIAATLTALSRSGRKPATSRPAIRDSRSAERPRADLSLKKIGPNQKEVVIPIAALIGRGYPNPIEIDTGSPELKPVESDTPRQNVQEPVVAQRDELL